MEAKGDRAYAGYDVATFGAGCFYIVEAVFMRIRGVKAVISGYAGGGKPVIKYTKSEISIDDEVTEEKIGDIPEQDWPYEGNSPE
jgi:peptide-methionine (S)-S-oxide reductase